MISEYRLYIDNRIMNEIKTIYDIACKEFNDLAEIHKVSNNTDLMTNFIFIGMHELLTSLQLINRVRLISVTDDDLNLADFHIIDR